MDKIEVTNETKTCPGCMETVPIEIFHGEWDSSTFTYCRKCRKDFVDAAKAGHYYGW